MIIKSKKFHHDNLELQAIYNEEFDVYTINIHRVNED